MPQKAVDDDGLGARVAVLKDGDGSHTDVERSPVAVRQADGAIELVASELAVRREARCPAVVRDGDNGDLVAGPQLVEELGGGAQRATPFAERDAVAIHPDHDQPSRLARGIGTERAVGRLRFRDPRPDVDGPHVHELGGDDLPRLPVDGDREFGAAKVGDRMSLIVDNIGNDFDHFRCRRGIPAAERARRAGARRVER